MLGSGGDNERATDRFQALPRTHPSEPRPRSEENNAPWRRRAVECFTKLTQGASKQEHFYVLPEPAKAILEVGLASENPTTVENAKKAQDNLLRIGHLEYLELETAK